MKAHNKAIVSAPKHQSVLRVMIAYPPIESIKGTAQISQNRQFQWFDKHSVIYPVVPAYAATMLKQAGYNVFWADGIAKKQSFKQFINDFKKFKPDIIAIETKTPVINYHWKIINKLKKLNNNCKIVLFGDHVTALPYESFNQSKVDYVLTGGDYDFLLLNLCNHLTNKEKLEKGIWYRTKKSIRNTGKFELNHDLTKLPLIDRELTKWQLYAYDNGNYKFTPGAYTMAGRDCWWGKCKFCSWPTLYTCFRSMKPEQLINEIEHLVSLGVKEVMDDTGTFPIGKWLKDFCNLMIKKGLNKKVRISCNMRFGVLKLKDYQLMRKAGFRFILYGFESANQSTLDRLNKGIKVKDITNGCRLAKKAGLDPHITSMIGYPWESYKQAMNTIQMAKELFSNGWVDTLQATIVIPYPGTQLYKECKKNKWLIYDGPKDWPHYDMREPVMKSPLKPSDVKKLTRELYKSFFTPRYVLRKIFSIRSKEDLLFIIKGVKKVFKHLTDFGGN